MTAYFDCAFAVNDKLIINTPNKNIFCNFIILVFKRSVYSGSNPNMKVNLAASFKELVPSKRSRPIP